MQGNGYLLTRAAATMMDVCGEFLQCHQLMSIQENTGLHSQWVRLVLVKTRVSLLLQVVLNQHVLGLMLLVWYGIKEVDQ